MIPICNACEANTPSARSSPIPPTVTHQTPSSPVVPRSLTHHVSHTQLSPSPPSRLSHALPVATHKPLAQRASLAQLFTPSPTSTSLVPPLPTRPSFLMPNVSLLMVRRASNAHLENAVPACQWGLIVGRHNRVGFGNVIGGVMSCLMLPSVLFTRFLLCHAGNFSASSSISNLAINV